MFGLKYKGKWIKAQKNLGKVIFTFTDNANEAMYDSFSQAKAARAIFAQDNDVAVSDIDIQELDL